MIYFLWAPDRPSSTHYLSKDYRISMELFFVGIISFLVSCILRYVETILSDEEPRSPTGIRERARSSSLTHEIIDRSTVLRSGSDHII